MPPRTAPDAAPDGVAAVDRALAIASALTRYKEPVSLAELARATGFYKSTLLRLLASLEHAALVVRRSDGRYALGAFAHQLGLAFAASYRLSDILHPLLARLVDSGTESASFQVVQDSGTRVCLLRVDSHHSTLDRIHAGTVLPLGIGAAGKLLADYRDRAGPHPLIYTSVGETDPNCAAVAAPVFGADGGVHGAISLSGPKERFQPAKIRAMSGLLQAAAADATGLLGGRWPAA